MALMVSPLLVCTTVVALSGRITRARLQPSPAAASAEELCGLSLEILDVSTADEVEARLKIKQFLSQSKYFAIPSKSFYNSCTG